VVRVIWRKPTWLAAAAGVLFLSVEVTFFAANLTKVVHGGWLPLVVAAAIFLLLMTWQRGRVIVTRNRTEKEGSLADFAEQLTTMEPPVQRVPGTAVFLNASATTTPLALRANVEYNHILHQAVVIVSVQFDKVPHVPDDQRLVINDPGYRLDGMAHITAHFGYQDQPDVPQLLRLPAANNLNAELDVEGASYFLSRMTIVRTADPGMPGWQKRLFLILAHNAANPAEYFGLPIERSISMGGQVIRARGGSGLRPGGQLGALRRAGAGVRVLDRVGVRLRQRACWLTLNAPEITAWEAMTVATVASSTIASCAQPGISRKNGLATAAGERRISAP